MKARALWESIENRTKATDVDDNDKEYGDDDDFDEEDGGASVDEDDAVYDDIDVRKNDNPEPDHTSLSVVNVSMLATSIHSVDPRSDPSPSSSVTEQALPSDAENSGARSKRIRMDESGTSSKKPKVRSNAAEGRETQLSLVRSLRNVRLLTHV